MDSAPNQRDYSDWFASTLQLARRLDHPVTVRPRPAPVIASMIGHGVLLALIAVSPAIDVQPSPSAYEQLIAGHERKLVWYKFKDKLPDVSPAASADPRPPRAEIKIAKQSIVSSPKNAPKATQMVWQPAPEIRLLKDVPSPNILALQLPAPRKEFVPPRPVERVATAKPLPAPPAPEIKPRAKSPEPLQELASLLPQKTFVPPPPRKLQISSQTPLLPNAPELASANASRDLPQSLTALPKTYKPFVPPAVRSQAGNGAGSGGTPAVPAPPELAPGTGLAAGLSANSLNAAVVGLNPSDRPTQLPEGSRAAQFSAGPKLNPDGGTGASGTGIAVPDLLVRGGGTDTRPTLMARSTLPPQARSSTSPEALREASKYLTVHDIGHPGARVSGAPDPRFEGRQVYTTAIQMPNITSYVGSWLMWYADRNAVPLNSGVITPPLPHRKVDPKYVPSAVDERVEGQVRLACVIQKNGRVELVQLVKGLDDRLDRSAIDALAKWEFTPAMRNGVPVDVDVLVEIPFRLAPQAKR